MFSHTPDEHFVAVIGAAILLQNDSFLFVKSKLKTLNLPFCFSDIRNLHVVQYVAVCNFRKVLKARHVHLKKNAVFHEAG